MKKFLLNALGCAGFGLMWAPVSQAGPRYQIQAGRANCGPVYYRQQPICVPQTYYYNQPIGRTYVAPVVVTPATVYYYPGYTRPYQLYTHGSFIR